MDLNLKLFIRLASISHLSNQDLFHKIPINVREDVPTKQVECEAVSIFVAGFFRLHFFSAS
jgi:hypothetical protein